MANQGKLPAFQFYPGDWRKDPGVQSLDYHTRGVWFELICLMHESEERGVLLLNGKPMPDEAAARLLGLDKQNLTTTLTTLLTYGIASRRESDGAIFSRRMVRDEEIRKLRANAGKMGGNPLLLKQNPTTGVKQNPTPSSSSSTSVSSSEVDVGPIGGSAGKPPAPSGTKRKPQLPDTDWIGSLKANAGYAGIDIERELGKCQAWCDTHGKQMSRRRFLNWLNRAERPMGQNGQTGQSTHREEANLLKYTI
jgi:hypothetical protein